MPDNNELNVITQKICDASIPQFEAEVSPLEADIMGAFVEDALDIQDALDSAIEGDADHE
ncbi:conjugal transfer protein TraD [Shewanella baltica]|uniref:conjugal transfer protein TraD n=1 Tax=Shewanella baltica TaxID=62322 RepID=UPI0030CC771D